MKVPSISRLVLTAYWAMDSNGYRLGPYLLFILLNHKERKSYSSCQNAKSFEGSIYCLWDVIDLKELF